MGEGKLSIEINGGSISVSTLTGHAPNAFHLFPMKLDQLILGVCYNTPTSHFNFYPMNSDDSRLPIKTTIDVGKAVEIPKGKISFNIRPEIRQENTWLCAQLKNEGGAFFPAN